MWFLAFLDKMLKTTWHRVSHLGLSAFKLTCFGISCHLSAVITYFMSSLSVITYKNEISLWPCACIKVHVLDLSYFSDPQTDTVSWVDRR